MVIVARRRNSSLQHFWWQFSRSPVERGRGSEAVEIVLFYYQIKLLSTY